MRTILFPTDFSERADKALVEAVGFANKFGAKLIIYHAYHRPYDYGGNTHISMRLTILEKKIDAQFKNLLDANSGLKKVDHEFHKELGFSSESIINASKTKNIDLIIMATKGANGFGELWGSKTEQIVKNVEVPVLVIPDNTSLNMTKVGLLCDYSAEVDYHTLDFLLEVVKKLKLNTDVITMNKDEKIMTPDEKAYRQLVRKKLESLPVTFNVTFNSQIEQGIITYSITNDIGLIAILPKHYKFIKHLFHESLTQKMTFHSPIPLLVLN